MYAARTNVGHRPNHAAEFVLQIEIPLHHITARGIRLDVTRALTCQTPWYVTLQHRGRGSRHRSGIALRDVSRKRRRCGRENYELIRQSKYVVETEPASHRRLAIVKRIPSKPDAGFEILQRRIIEIRIPRVNRIRRRTAQH